MDAFTYEYLQSVSQSVSQSVRQSVSFLSSFNCSQWCVLKENGYWRNNISFKKDRY